MRALRAALLIVASAACSEPAKVDAPGSCLPLPSVVRSGLIADPARGSLYWLEDGRHRDFEADLKSHWNLVRFDLQTRRSELVLTYVGWPIRLIQDKVVVLRATAGKGYWLALIDRAGHVQAVTPDYLDVIDVEILDDHTLVILADGDGGRGVYTLDLDRPRPVHVINADVLLSTSAGRIYVRSEGLGISIDATGGDRKVFQLPDPVSPNADGAIFVEGSIVRALSMSSGQDRTMINTPGPWKLLHQEGSVLARTPVKNRRSAAYLLSSGVATQLPTVSGGSSILAAARLGSQTWALIGHNNANYMGDLADTSAETDVCLLPRSNEVSFPTREVPLRYVAKQRRLYEAFAKIAPGATLQLLEIEDEPTTVSIAMTDEKGGTNLANMRARVRELHTNVTSLIGEVEVRTEVVFADRRSAFYRWRRTRLGLRTSVGMGDALMSDPTEFDLEVRELDNVVANDRITCAGTLVNMKASKLENLTLRCSGNRGHVIQVAELAPNAAHKFAQTFEVANNGGGTPLFEVFQGREQLDVRDAVYESRVAAVFELASQAYSETRLALEQHQIGEDIRVYLMAPTEFLNQSDEARSLAASIAYRRYETLKALYKVEPEAELSLRINVLTSNAAYDYDGSRLTVVE